MLTVVAWIQTHSGRRFVPLAARVEDVDLRDVAHSLSLQCRFNGHCRTFYSVAEHSVRVARILPPELELWGLLHDAAEAYLGDLPSPIKAQLPEFRRAEDELLAQIAERFGLEWPMPQPVVDADRVLLATEARDLMAPPPEPWGLDVEPLAEAIVPWPAERAERELLEALGRLVADD